MKSAPKILLALFCFAVAGIPAFAQGPGSMDWIPRGMEELSRGAAFHTDFTFDRTMLQMAGNIMYGGEQDVVHAIAKLNGISVHSYRFAAPGMYDPGRLSVVQEQYRAAGWKHMVSSEAHGLYNNTGHTDLWINFRGTDVTGMVVLLAGARDLNLIAISGDLSPLDLLHLRGHFGIPKFSGDHFEQDRSSGPPPAAAMQAPQQPQRPQSAFPPPSNAAPELKQRPSPDKY